MNLQKLTILTIIILLLLAGVPIIIGSGEVIAQQNPIDSLKQVIATAKEDTNKVKTLNVLTKKYQRINLDTSLIYAKQTLELAKKLSYKKGMLWAYNNIGIIHYYHSDFSLALENWNKELKIKEELKDKTGMSDCYNNIGIVHRNQGNYDKAIEFYKKSLKIDEELKNKTGMSSCYNNIGLVHSDQGLYDKAIEFYLRALKIKEEIKDKNGMSNCYNNIGIVHYEQGSYDKAIEFYKKSLKIDEELKNKNGMASCYNNIGNIHKRQGLYDKVHPVKRDSLFNKAIEFYLKALRLNEETGNKYWMSNNYICIGLVHDEQGLYDKAIEFYLRALKIKEKLGDKKGIASTYGNIASLHISLADSLVSIAHIDSALQYANKSLKIAQEINAKRQIMYANSHLSKTYWGLKQNKKAAENFNALIELDNKNILMNFSFISEKEKENFFATINQDYWQYNSFALEYKNTQPDITGVVYNNTVKNKGLLLKSNTAMRNAVQSSKDTLLIKKYKEWILLKKQIAKKYSKGENTKEIETQANELEGYLVKNSNEFSDFKKVQNISWEQVQTGLKENEAAIEFLHFPLLIPDSSLTDFTNQTQYTALIVTKESKYPEMLPLFEEKQLENIIGKFGGNNYSYINGIYGKNTEVNAELYNLIWAPIDSFLNKSVGVFSRHTDTKPSIYVSPSGLLHKISFSAIAKEQNVYLCDAYDIEMKSTTGKIVTSEGFAQT